MWIMLNDSFLSIVQKKGDTDTLTVRARVKGDIERVFPQAIVTVGAGTDYLCRARILRTEVAKAMSDEVMRVTYDNFKSSVKEDHRHTAYMSVWGVMNRYQIQRDNAPRKGRQAKLNLAGAH